MTEMTDTPAELKYTITNDTIIVIMGAGRNVNVKRGAPNFASLREALLAEDWRRAHENLTVKKKISDWAKGRFTYNEETRDFMFDGRKMPIELNERVLEMATRDEDPQALFNFFERLSRNPSMRSVEQLFKFLKHAGIPITERGTFLAYKGVKPDMRDCHTGTFDNSPGQTHKMPRNQISDDPREACHVGFHVGSESYARGFGQRVVICEVDPENVVCVPYDCSEQKMRVCEYSVVGHHGATLPSTAIDKSDIPQRDEDDDDLRDDDDDDCADDTSSARDLSVSEELAATVVKPARAVPQKYAHLLEMSASELIKQSYGVLRDYATNGLKIAGASRIKGGKSAIADKILELLGEPA